MRNSVEKQGGVSELLPGILQPASHDAFATAANQVATQNLASDAWKDVGNVGLASLGLGAGGAGLIALMKRLHSDKPKRLNVPNTLPLPYPVEEDEAPERLAKKGMDISMKAGLPWYGPAMMFTGMAGLGAGWKGVDSIMQAQAAKQRQKEIEEAKNEFHQAILSQYDAPIGAKAAAAPDELSQALDSLYDMVKTAMTTGDMLGMAGGGYGIYAGLSGLAAGALVYDKMRKRSQRAVLEKALQRRERRRFAMSPSPIYAQPEPMAQKPPETLTKSDADRLRTAPEESVPAV
jgi:hypothetical protein